MEAISKREFPSSRILVIDPHGEYNDALSKYSRVIETNPKHEINKLYIPFWALPFNELMKIFSGNLTDTQREYIREKVVEEKIKSTELNKLGTTKESITADSPIPFSIKKLWYDLDDFERQTFERETLADKTIILKLSKRTADGDVESLKSNEYPPAGLGSSPPFFKSKGKRFIQFS